jgi:hypothetical protein
VGFYSEIYRAEATIVILRDYRLGEREGFISSGTCVSKVVLGGGFGTHQRSVDENRGRGVMVLQAGDLDMVVSTGSDA